MDNGRELIAAIAQVAQEKNIDRDLIIEAIEASLVSACKRQFGQQAILRVVIDREMGSYTVYAQKTVSETIDDPNIHISLEDARKVNSIYELGDTLDIIVTPKDFGRIAAQTAKQVVLQKIREAERDRLYNDFITKEHDILTAIVQRRDRRNVIVSLGGLDAMLPAAEQMPRERYEFGDRIKVYVMEVKQSSKGPVVQVSRNHPDLLRRLFEQEVPEIFDGVVEVKSVARESGSRSKVAVHTVHPHVDAIGSCVGQGGQRINLISGELRGEKLDIINYNTDPAKYIAAALSPSKVVTVAISPYDNEARVIVPDHQLSLAIGKEGQNARLAAKLTGWRIDIKNESQVRGTDYLVFTKPEQPPAAEEETAKPEYYDDEYYDDEYDDDDYYDDEEYDDYYDDDEYYDEPEAETTA
jgi:N utilization substance protein A